MFVFDRCISWIERSVFWKWDRFPSESTEQNVRKESVSEWLYRLKGTALSNTATKSVDFFRWKNKNQCSRWIVKNVNKNPKKAFSETIYNTYKFSIAIYNYTSICNLLNNNHYETSKVWWLQNFQRKCITKYTKENVLKTFLGINCKPQ